MISIPFVLLYLDKTESLYSGVMCNASFTISPVSVTLYPTSSWPTIANMITSSTKQHRYQP
jgi:hypothetical protein